MIKHTEEFKHEAVRIAIIHTPISLPNAAAKRYNNA